MDHLRLLYCTQRLGDRQCRKQLLVTPRKPAPDSFYFRLLKASNAIGKEPELIIQTEDPTVAVLFFQIFFFCIVHNCVRTMYTAYTVRENQWRYVGVS